MVAAQSDGMLDERDDGGSGRKKVKPRQVFQTNIQPLTDDIVNKVAQEVASESLDDDGSKKKKLKLKKAQSTFQCAICKLEFTSKQLMLDHRSKHTKLFKCKTCSESFYTEEKLNRHLEKESHNYPCETCNKVLVSKASLQRHKVVHGEKNHVCDVCNRAFKTARDMKNHRIGKIMLSLSLSSVIIHCPTIVSLLLCEGVMRSTCLWWVGFRVDPFHHI